MGAPTVLEEARLRELNIALRKPVETKAADAKPVAESVHPDAAR